MTDYREGFEKLTVSMKEALEARLIGAFKNGLKPTIQVELQLVEVGLLKQLMGLAHKIEERNVVLEKTLEKDQEEFLNKHLKVMIATKFGGPKGTWIRVSGHPEPVCTQSLESNGSSSLAQRTRMIETKANPNSKSTTVASSTVSKGGSVRRISNAEAARRRSLRLCFKCEEKYSTIHQCKNNQLNVMLLQHVNEAGEIMEGDVEDENEEEIEP